MDDCDPAARLATRFPAKRAFITGAASGLGRALALEFARAGWRPGILDLASEGVESARSELQAAGARLVSHHVGSVGSEPFVSASVADFAERIGGLDVMINDAGVAVAGSLQATSPDDWRWIVDTNLLGVVWDAERRFQYGAGPVILHACMVKLKADRWRRGRYGLLNPIHGDPAAAEPVSVGPFSGGLPSKIEPGEMKSFYFPYDKDCFLKEPIHRAGICDTYGRNNWCRRQDVKKAAAAYLKDFGQAGPQQHPADGNLSALSRGKCRVRPRT